MAQQNVTQRPINFLLPEFMIHWPYERRLNPDFGTVDVDSANWVNEHRLFSAKAQKSFKASLTGLLGCLMFPTTGKDLCRTSCDLVNIILVFDEFSDVTEPEMAAQVCDLVMDVFHNPYKGRTPGDKLGIFMQEFWQRALKLTRPGAACIKMFVKGFEIYMKSMVQEAKDRESKHIRPVDEYLQLRRQTFGAYTGIALIAFGLELPEEVFSHPVMQSMLLAAMDLLCISNDMHSYAVELARGIAFHNIISSIIQEHGLSIPAAMCWLDDFGKNRVKAFLDGVKNLPSWGPEIDKNVCKYIERMGYLVRGADAWSYESERYWGNKGEEIRRTRIVTIFPKESQEGWLTREELRTLMV